MRKFLRGFYYAACGIIACIRTERNMRVHCCAAFYVLIFMRFYGFTSAEKSLIFLTIGAVMAAEAFNTAIESVVDMISPERNFSAKLAKDAAAGAVLLTAIAAAAVGLTLFSDTDTIKNIGKWLAENKAAAVLLAASALAWIYFITRPSGRKIKETENQDKEK